MSDVAVTLRPARPAEAQYLSSLALRSKAHWGYSPEFIAACRAELTVTPQQIATGTLEFAVAEVAGAVIGFAALAQLSETEFELEALFVEPAHIGTGVGRVLLAHMRDRAAERGATALIIQSDPNAEAFYRAAGAIVTGRTPSASIPGRLLPTLRLQISSPS